MIRARARAVRATLVAAAGLLIGAAAAAGAGGPVIPGGAYGGNGVTGPSGQPSEAYRYVTIDTDDGETIVEKIATDGGTVDSLKRLSGSWTLPAVTISGDASGLSADGDTLVLIGPNYGLRADRTSLLVLDTRRRIQRGEELALDGLLSFDAISPDGLREVDTGAHGVAEALLEEPVTARVHLCQRPLAVDAALADADLAVGHAVGLHVRPPSQS